MNIFHFTHGKNRNSSSIKLAQYIIPTIHKGSFFPMGYSSMSTMRTKKVIPTTIFRQISVIPLTESVQKNNPFPKLATFHFQSWQFSAHSKRLPPSAAVAPLGTAKISYNNPAIYKGKNTTPSSTFKSDEWSTYAVDNCGAYLLRNFRSDDKV